MLRGIQIAVGLMAAVAIICIGAFLYMTRQIAAPSADIQASVQQLETSDDSGKQIVFRISQNDSQVTYTLDEMLNGAAKTVVGATQQVAGDILVNFSSPAQSELGEVAVDARTFATDDMRRDNSVARFILQSEANEFITFQPTRISGLPSSVEVGDTLQFEITGNLMIAGITQAVTFSGTVTVETADKLTGHFQTTVNRSDFSLTIPNVPFVANVGDTVTLTVDFVANAVSADATSAA